ncbi:MAG: 2-oxoacid:acceptor oxidoreductase subunit alpha [Candidatus Shapirobacteria bacterium]
MTQSFTWKIGGEAGFGIMSTGLIFAKTLARMGLYAFDYSEYPSLIRGGHNVMSVHFGGEPVWAQEQGVDLLVALNQETLTRHQAEIKPNGNILADFEEMNKIIAQLGLSVIMSNNFTLGASIAYFCLPLEPLLEEISDNFKIKGEKVITDNQKAARAGFDYAKKKYTTNYCINLSDKKELLVMTGNEAAALGAIAAKSDFYASYPMTPSSSVLHYLAVKSVETGMIVRHAEDEIGVINEALGASFAGAKAMVGTSGGGFALMTEAVSLAGITELPLVILISQRPGPATGMPTWTEQGDLQMAMRAGHGEFPKIVLAPGDIEETFNLTQKAFYLAQKYRLSVILLLDKYLSESHKTVEKLKISAKGGLEDQQIKNSFYRANSYEHTNDGHTSEDAEVRKKQVGKRLEKTDQYLREDVELPQLYGDPKAKITLIGWGSTKGPVLEAISNKQLAINYLHFTHLWPFPKNLKLPENLVLVENNATAQLGQVIRQETGIEIKNKLLKYDGRPFYPEEIEAYVGKAI